MKIELKIDDKEVEISQSERIVSVSAFEQSDPLHPRFYPVPNIFYYTNNLDFDSCQEIEFFNHARGQTTLFIDKNVTIYEDITNMDNVKSFYNRFDIYNIAWEILNCDNSKKEEIIKYLTQCCYFEILPSGKLLKYPFTTLSNNLFTNIGSFLRIERNKSFYIKLRRSCSDLDNSSFKKLDKFLHNTILRIYLYGNYWLEKRE